MFARISRQGLPKRSGSGSSKSSETTIGSPRSGGVASVSGGVGGFRRAVSSSGGMAGSYPVNGSLQPPIELVSGRRSFFTGRRDLFGRRKGPSAAEEAHHWENELVRWLKEFVLPVTSPFSRRRSSSLGKRACSLAEGVSFAGDESLQPPKKLVTGKTSLFAGRRS